MAEHNEVGKIGENIAVSFLVKQGFSVIERNYSTRHGELDIIATKDTTLHCIEVKSVKVRELTDNSIAHLAVRPEDNLTPSKWSKILVAFEEYKKHTGVPHELAHQIDLACVYIDTEKREGRVKLIQNVNSE
jgi:putative endonuclease